MSSIQYGASAPRYQIVQREEGKKQRLSYELEANSYDEPLTRVNAYEIKMSRFGKNELVTEEPVAAKPKPKPTQNGALNPLDLDRNGIVTQYEITQAQNNPNRLSFSAKEQLKKILDLQSAMSTNKQTLGLDPNNGHAKNTKGHLARMERPAFVGNTFSA